MRKSLLLPLAALLAAAATVTAANARLTAADAFVSASPDAFPYVDSLTRLDMIDYFNSGMDRPSTNAFGGDARVTAISKDAITVRTAQAVTVDIALLPAGRDTLLAMITTYALPGGDSKLQIFDRNWRELPAARYFTAPARADWLTREAGKRKAEINAMIPFVPAAYSYDPATSTLTVRNSIESLMSQPDYDSIKPYVIPAVTYAWTGSKFKRTR